MLHSRVHPISVCRIVTDHCETLVKECQDVLFVQHIFTCWEEGTCDAQKVSARDKFNRSAAANLSRPVHVSRLVTHSAGRHAPLLTQDAIERSTGLHLNSKSFGHFSIFTQDFGGVVGECLALLYCVKTQTTIT
jgi:hypothetical protein